jgi:hypothetical protein
MANPEYDLFDFSKMRSVHRYIKHRKLKIPSKVFEIYVLGISYNIPKQIDRIEIPFPP